MCTLTQIRRRCCLCLRAPRHVLTHLSGAETFEHGEELLVALWLPRRGEVFLDAAVCVAATHEQGASRSKPSRTIVRAGHNKRCTSPGQRTHRCTKLSAADAVVVGGGVVGGGNGRGVWTQLPPLEPLPACLARPPLACPRLLLLCSRGLLRLLRMPRLSVLLALS